MAADKNWNSGIESTTKSSYSGTKLQSMAKSGEERVSLSLPPFSTSPTSWNFFAQQQQTVIRSYNRHILQILQPLRSYDQG